MRRIVLFLGALIASASLFSQSPASALPGDPIAKEGQLSWFSLTESPDQIKALLGRPAMAASTGSDHLSWQYQIGDIDHHDFSHVFLFRKTSSTLVSVTRNFEPERTVDEFFPPAGTTVHHFPNAEHPALSLRLRRLPGRRVILAIGSPAPGRATGQLVLMQEGELPVFYPWLAKQLGIKPR
ncbi:MAG: hypothetical protein ABI972_15370 [Acidobacteriota bacterium]